MATPSVAPIAHGLPDATWAFSTVDSERLRLKLVLMLQNRRGEVPSRPPADPATDYTLARTVMGWQGLDQMEAAPRWPYCYPHSGMDGRVIAFEHRTARGVLFSPTSDPEATYAMEQWLAATGRLDAYAAALAAELPGAVPMGEDPRALINGKDVHAVDLDAWVTILASLAARCQAALTLVSGPRES